MGEIEDLQAQLAELKKEVDENKVAYEKLKTKADADAKDLEEARSVNKKLILNSFTPVNNDGNNTEDDSQTDPDADKSIEEVADEITKECLERKVMPALTGRAAPESIQGQRTVQRTNQR